MHDMHSSTASSHAPAIWAGADSVYEMTVDQAGRSHAFVIVAHVDQHTLSLTHRSRERCSFSAVSWPCLVRRAAYAARRAWVDAG